VFTSLLSGKASEQRQAARTIHTRCCILWGAELFLDDVDVGDRCMGFGGIGPLAAMAASWLQE
jgi:hypothetical protein